MDHNEAAQIVLTTYRDTPDPQFALLVKAPWGAGKTHFVKTTLNVATDNDVRYTSLNGIDTPKAFRRSLVAPDLETINTGALEGIGNALGKLVKIGDTGTLLRDSYETKMFAELPDTLIFDDLERCQIELGVLLGLINDFVEHQGKRVIIIAHAEKHKDHDKYAPQLEKLIGQTVSIKADVRNALPIFINKMPEGRGQKWVKENADQVIDVFTDAGHNNLRVLRQTVHALGRVLDKFDDTTFAGKDGVRRFARCYLALAMGLSVGQITVQHIETRGALGDYGPDESRRNHPFWVFHEQHEQDDVLGLGETAVLPAELGVSLLVHGYADPIDMNITLRVTKQFSEQDNDPLWRRLIHWWKLSDTELTETVSQAKDYVLGQDDIEVGPYLHIVHNLMEIEDLSGTPLTDAPLLKQVCDRIKTLRKDSNLPIAEYGHLYGWSSRIGGISFGGYRVEPKGDFKAVVDLMKSEQEAAFQDQLPDQVDEIQTRLKRDFNSVVGEFMYSQPERSFFSLPVAHHFDADLLANEIYAKISGGDQHFAGILLEQIAGRHNNNNGDWADEIKWAAGLRARLEACAKVDGQLAQAKLQRFLMPHWKFATPE